ncbi:MAG: acetyl-CoA hydrolase/transferase family protein [Ruminococcaceae bacterium]|nr:acetyl-CoA hydrolase/transferase family protein [Oscillospiraceae bacterium]
MDYKQMYRDKTVSVEEALSKIKNGDVIFSALAAQEPVKLLSNLHTIADRIDNVTIDNAIGLNKFPFLNDEQYADKFTIDGLFFMAPARDSHAKRLLSTVPGHLHNQALRWREYHKPNVFLGAVSAMDEHGYMRFSLSNVAEKDAAEECELVIVEVNPNLPLVYGDTEIHISEIDYLVEAPMPVFTLEPGTPSPEEMTIGQYVSELVEDGSTIQLGIGGIPDAAAMAFMNKRDLGVHTELLTNSIVDLVEAGVITNRKKTYFKGKMVATFALGSQRLYDMMHNNPAVCIMRGPYVNNPFNIAKNDKMISINSAVEVDLTGQIASEAIGTRTYSGSGGQNDTAEGAIHSKGGKSIIALRSTAKNGTISTIKPVLSLGAVVTMSRNNIDYIVTEFGIAPMRGRSVVERIENLIAIAHPDFRAELRKGVEAYKIW